MEQSKTYDQEVREIRAELAAAKNEEYNNGLNKLVKFPDTIKNKIVHFRLKYNNIRMSQICDDLEIGQNTLSKWMKKANKLDREKSKSTKQFIKKFTQIKFTENLPEISSYSQTQNLIGQNNFTITFTNGAKISNLSISDLAQLLRFEQ
jgi:transposase-like protein